MPFVAQYRGECAECHGPVAPGDEVEWRGSVRSERGEVIHVKCPEQLSELTTIEARVGPCPRCTSYHPGDC